MVLLLFDGHDEEKTKDDIKMRTIITVSIYYRY